MIRTINKIVTGSTQYDGAGVKLVRVIGYNTVQEFDPFLMLDAFDSDDPNDYIKGFPWHPHRGIETVTYLIKGDIEHGDSLGNKGSILDGCCQWMTAGSGILHQEMPKETERMLGIQLWLNLPSVHKMAAPKYHDIKANMIPKIVEDGLEIRIISGHYKEVAGAVQGEYVKMQFLDVNMQPDATWELQTNRDDNVFVYIVEGAGWFVESKEQMLTNRRAVLFNKGTTFKATASNNGMRLLLFAAPSLKEPVAWGGPIVMNTQHELDVAFRELDTGTFIK
ncbi:MAG: pirin family protein [Lachnospiraceae bacterium]|nr:pirin family protein [Lachnospiraceae bacterium]